MTPLERFFAIVERELEADGVELYDAGAAVSLHTNDLMATLPDSRQLVARFERPLEDRDGTAARLRLLIETFASTIEGTDKVGKAITGRPGRSVAQALHEELAALAERARAVDAFVIDAHSPVVWGAATAKPPVEEATLPEASREVLDTVRALSAMDQLAKGRHLRHIECGPDGGYAAHSFASIYLVVLVFDALYDELRAERAVLEALPHVEGLVLALPPFDPGPPPYADVIAIRRRRR